MIESIQKKLPPALQKFFNKETISYLFWGVVTTIVNIVVYKACTLVNIHFMVSTAIAWAIAVALAFITNKLFVFQSKSMKLDVLVKEATAFVVARLLSGACDMAFMWVSVEICGMDDFIAKIIANVFVVIANYVLSKLFIFKDKSVSDDAKENLN